MTNPFRDNEAIAEEFSKCARHLNEHARSIKNVLDMAASWEAVVRELHTERTSFVRIHRQEAWRNAARYLDRMGYTDAAKVLREVESLRASNEP